MLVPTAVKMPKELTSPVPEPLAPNPLTASPVDVAEYMMRLHAAMSSCNAKLNEIAK